jgi:2-oxoglutarate dehydrogenase E2 component (dihydrolipoamide succinyltransferase)
VTRTASVDIRAPAEQTEGTRAQVLRWLKAVGDAVTENEPLIELETDKVTVEIASPGAGILAEILKGEAAEVSPGEVLGRIAPGEVLGRAPPADVTEPSSAASGAAAGAAQLLSPAVRKLLAEYSLDPAGIPGTGEGGRITVQDVMASIAKPRVSLTDELAITDKAGPVRRVPHSTLRRRIAEHMVRSLLQTAPHVTTVFEADMAAVLAHRERHRQAFCDQGVPLTLTAYFLQAAVTALRAVPEANSRWTEAELEIFDAIHIGVATSLEDELVVPVVRNLEKLDLLGTARELNSVVTRARERKLTPGDVRGGTFTISNHGVSGSLIATPIIINQPQSAILGVGKLEKRPVVIEDRIEIQPRCYVTLTIDHRVMDGHRANRFMQVFTGRLKEWRE